MESPSLALLQRFRNEGGKLQPGELLQRLSSALHEGIRRGRVIESDTALERIRLLSDFAAQIAGITDGARVGVVAE
jgi:hypothetical protein